MKTPAPPEFKTIFRDRTAEQIVKLRSPDSSADFLLRALAWMDLAKRHNSGSAIHYSAVEFRYGIEHLVFELIDAAKGIDGEKEYLEMVHDFPGMVRKLKKDIQISKFTAFNRIAIECAVARDPMCPEPLFFEIGALMTKWSDASKFLHFCGGVKLTHKNPAWVQASASELETLILPMWIEFVDNPVIGFLRPNEKTRPIWDAFAAGQINDDEVQARLMAV